MARKHQLRMQREGTVINLVSATQEKTVMQAVQRVGQHIQSATGLAVYFRQQIHLDAGIVTKLRAKYPDVDFGVEFDNTFIKPDGGFLYLMDSSAQEYPILISEAKNQGTNDLREQEGKPRQAKGNAIERLGKNVIGLRALMLDEDIFPFVCFGYGCDFEPSSSIRDRVATIAMFGKLNRVYLYRQGPRGEFQRGSFFFRPEEWTVPEMVDVMTEIADGSVRYYLERYGSIFNGTVPLNR